MLAVAGSVVVVVVGVVVAAVRSGAGGVVGSDWTGSPLQAATTVRATAARTDRVRIGWLPVARYFIVRARWLLEA